MSSTSIIKALRASRREQGIRQSALAEAVGYHPQTLCRMEQLQRATSLFTVCAVANALGYELVLQKRNLPQ